MTKKILGVLLAMLVPVMSVSAITIDSVSVKPKDNAISINGTANSGEAILLSVVKEDANSEFFAKLGYQDGVISGEKGAFAFDFKMSGAGLYRAVAATEEETAEYRFAFSDDTSARGILTQVNAAASEAETETLLKDNRYVAGLYIDGLAEPSYAAIAQLVYSNKPYSEGDTTNFISTMQKFYLMTALENKQIDNIFKYKPYTGILEVANIDVFDSEIFTTSHETYATELLSGRSFDDADEFTDSVVEAAVLAVIKNPNGFGNIRKVLKAFENKIGIDSNKGSDVVYRKMQGLELKSFDEIKQKFISLCEDVNSNGNNGTGGTGGSSGGGGGSSSSVGKEPVGSGNILYETQKVESVEGKEMPLKHEYFDDIEEYVWAAESINMLASRGIVSGKENRKFCPGDFVTRSEFIKLIVEAFDIADSDGEVSFADVDKNKWDYKYIKAGYNAGIIKGMSDKMFGGDSKISRQDMAVILSRVAKLGDKMADEKFADDREIAGYAYDAVYILKGAGVLNGDDNNRFNPKSLATRAEAAKVIYSIMK